MKLIKLLIPMLTLVAFTSGCTKEYYSTTVENYNGAQVKTRQYTVNPIQWNRNQGPNLPGADNYLYASVENPDITDSVMAFGTVQAFVYSVYDMQNQLGAWNTLPFIFPLELNVYDQHGIFDHTEIIPENIRFEWEKGMVTFIIQDLNGIDPANIASPYTFKVCVTK